ncbi:forkhead box protein H1 [Amia ocellicauda]|uniref:forkhead box protein H1 n=1 Tax=Amia ocellicauda TaxID=2972642 RepID=UPI003463BF9F
MTKHWEGSSLQGPPALAYLHSPRSDLHLDWVPVTDPQRSPEYLLASVSLLSPAPQWSFFSSPRPVEPRGEKTTEAAAALTPARAPMDKSGPLEPSGISALPFPVPHLAAWKEGAGGQEQNWDGEADPKGGKKKNYQRYPKPPYSYLAMIAMVIQNSPEKKLTLSQILKEISTLFPFFKGNYKGWRDSVRHNLSSYDCFVKVLKDPGKPQGKGNFWAVDVGRVPLDLLKRQNTAVSRQEEALFAHDLAPYILQGAPPAGPVPPPAVVPPPPPPPGELYRPRLDSPFAIDALLHSLHPASAAGEPGPPGGGWEPCAVATGRAPPAAPPPPRPRYSSSAHSTSASSTSPPSSSSSEDDCRGARPGKRQLEGGEASSDSEEGGGGGYEDGRPLHKSRRPPPAPWELPTSYTKFAPPNAVAPPSMCFSGGGSFLPLGGLPFYSFRGPPAGPPPPHSGPPAFFSPAYWPLLPRGGVSLQPSPLLVDLDSLLQSVPPNKSVFDAMGHPEQPPAHAQLPHLAHYSPY